MDEDGLEELELENFAGERPAAPLLTMNSHCPRKGLVCLEEDFGKTNTHLRKEYVHRVLAFSRTVVKPHG